MSQFIIFFSEVNQDPSNEGTDKIGADVDDSVTIGLGGEEMHSIGEILNQNSDKLAYGSERVELVTAQTSFAHVNTTYMGAQTLSIFENPDLVGQEMLYVEGQFGVTVPVVQFNGTREEFERITQGFPVEASVDFVLDVYGADNIHSGTILMQGERGNEIGESGIDISELNLPLEDLINENYSGQLAAAREWSSGSDYGQDYGVTPQATPQTFTP